MFFSDCGSSHIECTTCTPRGSHRGFQCSTPSYQVCCHQSRHHWDVNEPKKFSRASGISDSDLVKFTIEDDLVEVRSGPTSYGVVIFGKIRIPAVDDEEGEGFVHVRFVIVLCHSNVDVTLTSVSVEFTIPPIE